VAERTKQQAFFIAPSGRIHGTDKCVASPGRMAMTRVRMTQVEWREG
jgi:hypothetical protein